VSVWLMLFSAACLPPGPVQGDDDAGPPSLSHSESLDSASAATFLTAIVGEALADTSRFQGTESLEITDTEGQVLCRWTWDAHHASQEDKLLNPMPPCALASGSACQFAHLVVLSGGHEDSLDTGSEADCEPYRTEYPMQQDGGMTGYGYAEGSDGGLLMVFADNPDPEADRWIALSSVSAYAEGVLEYRMEWGDPNR